MLVEWNGMILKSILLMPRAAADPYAGGILVTRGKLPASGVPKSCSERVHSAGTLWPPSTSWSGANKISSQAKHQVHAAEKAVCRF